MIRPSHGYDIFSLCQSYFAGLPACPRFLYFKFIQDSPFSGGQILQSQGLVSIDRSMVAALLSTTPRLAPRSSANDLAPQHCTVMGMVSAGEAGDSFVPQHALGPSRCGSSTAYTRECPRVSLPPNVEVRYGIVAYLGRLLT